MPTYTLTNLQASINSLTPHIEERAFKYSMYAGALPSRVTVYSDMQGYNTRKVSEYFRTRRATKLSEGVAYGEATAKRGRTYEVTPSEWGDSFPISERRITTDLENIVGDVVEFLGDSLAMRKEKEMWKLLISLANSGNTLSQSSNDYSIGYTVGMQQEFVKRAFTNEQVFTLLHPFQTKPVLKELVDLSKNADNVTRSAVRSWLIGGSGNLEVAEAPSMPRKVVYKLNISATSGTFKLRAGENADGVEQITANITVSTTPATMVTNIQNALNALSLGTWAVSGSANNNLTVTPPATLYVDAEDELQIPRLADGTLDAALTGGTVTIQERSATALSPMFTRSALVLDVRTPCELTSEVDLQKRVLLTYGREVYGVSRWRDERIYFLETKADSEFAVGS